MGRVVCALCCMPNSASDIHSTNHGGPQRGELETVNDDDSLAFASHVHEMENVNLMCRSDRCGRNSGNAASTASSKFN
jgi:hypothetical protein